MGKQPFKIHTAMERLREGTIANRALAFESLHFGESGELFARILRPYSSHCHNSLLKSSSNTFLGLRTNTTLPRGRKLGGSGCH